MVLDCGASLSLQKGVQKERREGWFGLPIYGLEIYRKHMFPYALSIVRANPSKRVIILEDGDKSHINGPSGA